jgi:hypothetical protein
METARALGNVLLMEQGEEIRAEPLVAALVRGAVVMVR